MATTYSEEKTPTEIIRIGADFTSSLLNGESIINGNVVVDCVNTLTDDPAPSILSGSPTITGNVVTQKVTGGAIGEVYTIRFTTGLTTYGLKYDGEVNLIITSTPATAASLASRDDVKQQLNITDDSDNDLIDNLLVAASTYIRKRTGRDFLLQEYQEKIIIEDGNIAKVKLGQYPVQNVTRIEVFAAYDTQTLLFDVVDSAQYDFLTEGFVWFDYNSDFYFEQSPGFNIVTYKAGFAKIPEDVKKATIDLAVGFYRSIGREGLSEEKIGDYYYRTRKLNDFPVSLRRELNDPLIEGVISRYMNHNMGFIDEESYDF